MRPKNGSAKANVRVSDFDYNLPEELIAQYPAPQRDASRLMVVRRETGKIELKFFSDILDYLNPHDLLVVNNSKVIPARLRARNPTTQGLFEILLLEETQKNVWWA